MAITILGQPDIFTPAFNPIVFYVDSDNKNKGGFSYVFDVYSAGTAQLITSVKIKPRPIDGYGVTNLNQVLKSYVNFNDIDQDLNTFAAAPNAHVNYDIEFGEEYIQSWDYVDTNFYTGGQTVFVGTGGTQPYLSGDTILVVPNSGGSQYFAGVYTVLSADSNNILVDYLFTSPTGVTDGTIYFSDKRKVINQDLEQLTGYTAFDGAIGHQQLNTYTASTYDLISGAGANMLTNIPDEYTIYSTNQMWLNYYTSQPGIGAYFAQIETKYGLYVSENSYTGDSVVQTIAIGPYNVTAIEGTANPVDGNYWEGQTGDNPIFKNVCFTFDTIAAGPTSGSTTLSSTSTHPWASIVEDTADIIVDGIEYTVVISTIDDNTIKIEFPFSTLNGLGITELEVCQKTEWFKFTYYPNPATSASSKEYTFNVKWHCGAYDNIELYFVDRLGSLVPANFSLQNYRTMNVSRQEYTRYLGDLQGTRWGFDSIERGRTNINTKQITQLVLNSDWLSEAEVNYLRELYSSPNVFIKENGKLWPVIVKTDSFQILTKKNKKNIQIQITIEYANNDVINNAI